MRRGLPPAPQRPFSPEGDDEEETDRSPARPSTLGVRPKPVASPRVYFTVNYYLKGN